MTAVAIVVVVIVVVVAQQQWSLLGGQRLFFGQDLVRAAGRWGRLNVIGVGRVRHRHVAAVHILDGLAQLCNRIIG